MSQLSSLNFVLVPFLFLFLIRESGKYDAEFKKIHVYIELECLVAKAVI